MLFIFINAAYSQDKFIELEYVKSVLAKNDESSKSIRRYSLSDCNFLEQFDSLCLDYKQRDSLHINLREITLTKEYENIEALITNFDKNLISYLEDTYGIAPKVKDVFGRETKIYFPVLKYKNRVFVELSYTYSSYSFIIDLKNPQEAIVLLIYFIHDTPVR